METADFVTVLFEGPSNPAKVTVGFVMAVNALARGHSSTLVLMVEGVKLGLPGATDGLAAGHPFAPVSELLAKFLAQGGRVALCASCLEHFGYGPADVVPGYEIITAGEVVDLLTAARGSLQVT